MALPRVIVSTDIGGADNDDMELMAHFLLASDQFQVEALISTPTAHAGRTSSINKALDAYAKDYANLKTWGDYATPDYLKSIVHQGSINVPGSKGYGSSSEGSKAIVNAAHEAKAAGEPLWVLAWGALTDVAQALHDDPSIAGTLRVLASNGWNATQDPNSYTYIYNNFKDLWFVESKSTHRGIYINSSGNEGNSFNMNEAKGHGALGDYFYNARPSGVKMGDSWTIAYLTDTADNNNPKANSWGGTFVQTGHGAHYWTDDSSSSWKVGGYNGAKHVRDHQADIYKDMYRLFDRADAPKGGTTSPTNPTIPGAGDHPVAANDDAVTATKNAALVVKVLANDAGVDGLHLSSINANSTQGGHVVMNSDGSVTYTPKAGFIGSDSFSYMAKDADGDWDTATVKVTVKDTVTTPPSPPTTPSTGDHGITMAHDSVNTAKNAATVINVLTNDTAPDGGLHIASINQTSAQGGHVVLNIDGTLLYTPKAGFTGNDSFGYMAKDGDGDWGTATVFLSVKDGAVSSPSPAADSTSTPTPPTLPDGIAAGTDVYKVDEGRTLYFNSRYLTTNDKGGTGAYSVTSVDKVSEHGVSVSWGAEGTAQDGTTVYKASGNWSGTDHIHYTVTDASGHTGTGTIDIQVSPLLLA